MPGNPGRERNRAAASFCVIRRPTRASISPATNLDRLLPSFAASIFALRSMVSSRVMVTFFMAGIRVTRKHCNTKTQDYGNSCPLTLLQRTLE